MRFVHRTSNLGERKRRDGSHMRQLWKVWRMNTKDLFNVLGAMLLGFLLGIFMVAVIVQVADADSYGIIGSMMAMIIWLAMVVLKGAISLEKQFNIAVGLGETRKEFIICQFMSMFANTVIELLVLMVLNILEKKLWEAVYPFPCELDVVTGFFRVRSVLAVIFLAPSLTMFFGMLILKFQKKAFWFLWGFWMVGSLGLARVSDFMENNPNGTLAMWVHSVIESIKVIGVDAWFLAGLLLAAALLAIAAAMLEKQPITQF